MADESGMYNILNYAQAFQKGKADLQDTQQQVIARTMQNELAQRQMDAWQKFAASDSAPPATQQGGPGVTIGPWQDMNDPSAGGPLQNPGAAFQNPKGVAAANDSETLPGDTLRAQADKMTKAAGFMFQGGAGASGMDLVKNAAEIRAKAAEMDKAAVTAQQEKLTTALKGLEAAGQIFNGVHDQTSWDQARAQFAQIPGLSPGAVDSIPVMYSPAALKAVQDHAMTRKDQLTLQQQGIANILAERKLDAITDYRAQMNQIKEEQLAEREYMDDIKRKAGADAAIPKPEEVKQVRDIIVNSVYGGNSPDKMSDTGKVVMSDPSLDAGAATVAARAKAILQQNPALNWNGAVHRAVSESVAAGDWPASGGPEALHSDGSGTGVHYPGFKPQGKLPDEAIPLPKDKSKWKKDTYYTLPNGKVAKWDGT